MAADAARTPSLHILGVCGTFMGGIALLAREAGYRVAGSDADVYPPMSTQLEAAGISLHQGYDAEALEPAPDCVVVGNALSRGNPAVEHLLDRGLDYRSGPQWLAEHVLRGRWVIAVAGTHGKTTTAAMVAWILECAGLGPGFLIGGVPGNFGVSARTGAAPFFVVEADEYDTAFFDKRSKFVHYRPRTAVLGNLEFDHADIFEDLAAIQRQFHHLVRTVPANGLIVAPAEDANLAAVFEQGCWTPIERLATHKGTEACWQARTLGPDCSRFEVRCEGAEIGVVEWALVGRHNVSNALAALAAARHAGVPPAVGVQALATFRPPRRRMELRGEVDGVRVWDDFAHHPTAIRATLEGLRGRVRKGRILAILEPRSATMRRGVHREALAGALADADRVYLYRPAGLSWDPATVAAALGEGAGAYGSVVEIVAAVCAAARAGDEVLVMSNGGFEAIHERLLAGLAERGR